MLIKCLSNTYQLYVKNLPQTRAKLQKSQSGMGTMSYLPNTKTIPRRILLRLCRSCFQKLRTQQLNSLILCKLQYGLYKKYRKTDSKNSNKIYTSLTMKKLLIIGTIGLCLASCNVTRTITTQSQYYQKGDTTCTIVTKTIESYDATKKIY